MLKYYHGDGLMERAEIMVLNFEIKAVIKWLVSKQFKSWENYMTELDCVILYCKTNRASSMLQMTRLKKMKFHFIWKQTIWELHIKKNSLEFILVRMIEDKKRYWGNKKLITNHQTNYLLTSY